MLCVLKESSTPSFIVECGRFGANKIGNRPKSPMHGDMQPSEECGPEKRWRGCGHTQGAPKPWWAHLTTAFAWSVPGWAWTLPPLVLGPGCCVKVGFSISHVAHFCFTLSILRLLLGFPLVFKCSPTKHVSSNISGTISK